MVGRGKLFRRIGKERANEGPARAQRQHLLRLERGGLQFHGWFGDDRFRRQRQTLQLLPGQLQVFIHASGEDDVGDAQRLCPARAPHRLVDGEVMEEVVRVPEDVIPARTERIQGEAKDLCGVLPGVVDLMKLDVTAAKRVDHTQHARPGIQQRSVQVPDQHRVFTARAPRRNVPYRSVRGGAPVRGVPLHTW